MFVADSSKFLMVSEGLQEQKEGSQNIVAFQNIHKYYNWKFNDDHTNENDFINYAQIDHGTLIVHRNI